MYVKKSIRTFVCRKKKAMKFLFSIDPHASASATDFIDVLVSSYLQIRLLIKYAGFDILSATETVTNTGLEYEFVVSPRPRLDHFDADSASALLQGLDENTDFRDIADITLLVYPILTLNVK